MARSAEKGRDVNPWPGVLAALCANLVGVGLGRFAYTPLIPALAEAGWFGASEAVYLGAANLAGYLLGALLTVLLAPRRAAPRIVPAMMALASIALFACAAPLSFAWYLLWRFASGLTGGVLMALAAPLALSFVPAEKQGLAGGVIMMGPGLGVGASGLLTPLLLGYGLVTTWLVLAGMAALLTAIAFACRLRPREITVLRGVAPPSRALRRLYLEYGLGAFGLVPHMVFLVDFIASDLGRGLATGAFYWVLFGIGALIGPLAAGGVADRIGFQAALRGGFVLQTLCVGWLALSGDAVGLAISSVVMGAFVPGIVVLALGRVHEILPDDGSRRAAAWGVATIAFAVGQAVAAYLFSALFDWTGGYALCFALAAAAMLLALILDLLPLALEPVLPRS